VHRIEWQEVKRDANITVVSGRCMVCGTTTAVGAADSDTDMDALRVELTPLSPCGRPS
jgi:hypothetical protein